MKPEQLLQIEANSPHIAIKSQEIWKHLVTRDFQDKGVQAIEKAISRGQKRRDSSDALPDNDNAKDNAVLAINFRKVYKKMEAARKANLDMASDRLRANIAKMNQDKDNWKITQLNIDPQSVRSNALRKLGPSTPIGSRMLHKTIRHTLDHGPNIFSHRNIQFMAKHNLQLNNRVIRPPRGTTDFNRPYIKPPTNPYKNLMKRKAPAIDSFTSRKRDFSTITSKGSTAQKMFSIKPPTVSNQPSSISVSNDIKYKFTPVKVSVPESGQTTKSAIFSIERPTSSASLNRRHNDVSANTISPQPCSSASDQASSTSPSRKVIIRQRKTPSIFITKR